MPVNGVAAPPRLADAITTHYGCEVHEITRVPRGLGAANWLVRTAGANYFVKQYRAGADVGREVQALELSQAVRAAGVPSPAVIPTRSGKLIGSEHDLRLSLFEYLPGTTSGVALSRPEMEQAGHTLGRLHRCLRGRRGLDDTAKTWLALDLQRKRANFERYLAISERRQDRDRFDRRTAACLIRRLELLPKAAALLGSLPSLARQVVHGDYSLHNVLFRGGELVAVVDFRPPEIFLPAFEIGRAALNPETTAAGPGWLEKARAFAEHYCRANPDVGLSDVRFAPHVWAIQLVRSEYGVRQHYCGPVERQAELDRFWFERCETAERILGNLDQLSECFGSAWERRTG